MKIKPSQRRLHTQDITQKDPVDEYRKTDRDKSIRMSGKSIDLYLYASIARLDRHI
jgi:hypothetical protein